MGLYINPSDRSKEQWLKENGTVVVGRPPGMNSKEGHLPVCLMDNGPFTAAGICCDNNELMAFGDPKDYRPKQWFLVPIERLLQVCPDRRIANLA